MHSPVRPEDEPNIDQLLALADVCDSPDIAADSTVNRLRDELETIATELKRPFQPVAFESEPDCVRAVELAANLAPTTPPQPKSSSVVDANSSELGDIGQYKLLKLLGQGGMGAVYKALHPQLEKVVAVKVLRASRIKREMVDRFKREMKALGKLDHPNLIRALDAGEADGTHFLVMEFVTGIDLSALLAERGKLPCPEACELIIQAATGLHAAHSRRMIHRDIKPANLMLAEQEFGPPIVKVLDLGLALLSESQTPTAGELTSDGQIMGTIDYMPPEQAQNSHLVDERADVYSLGATLYALLSGGSIFHGRPHTTLMQKLMALATEPIPSLLERRPDVPQSLVAVVHRMVARDPNQRFASMAEVINALKPFAAGADLSALLSGEPIRRAATIDEDQTVPLVTPDMRWNGPASGSTVQLATASGPSGNTLPRKNKALTFIATAAAAVLLLGAIVLSLKTQNGEIVVEIPDDVPAEVRKQIKINVTGDGTAEVASEANGWKVGIKEGTFNVGLAGGGDQVQIQEKQVTVSRQGKAIVTVTMKPLGEMAAKPNSDKPASPGRQFAEWLKTIPQITFDVMLATGGDYRVGPEQSLPENMSSVRAVFLQGPVLDQPGHAFAEEFAKRVKGTSLNFLQVGSPTLTTEQASRFLQLPEMADLRTVSLGSDEIDDGIVESLARLKKLTHLSLRCSKITGKGLSQLRELISLAFNGTVNVTVEGFEEFGQLSKLTHLQMGRCPFTERHVEAISKLKLDNLETYDAGITDAVLKRLTSINTLTSLALTKSPITDADLQELKKLKSLVTLHLMETKVTAAGVADLQKALPHCNILWDDPDPERRVTEWLLSLKHPPKLDLGKDGQPWLTLQPGQALPADKFHLYFIQFDKPEHDELGDEFVDELAKHLSGTRQLARLQFSGRKLTAAGLAKLVRLPELADVQDLLISPETMNDAMVAELAVLKKLIHLSISRASNISGKNFGLLKGLVALHLLECQNLTPEGLEELQQLPLELLTIGNLRLTEKHVAAIAGLKKLRRLHTQGIDDSTVAGLASMESLFWLGFENSQLTDKGLQELKNFKGLKATNVNAVITLSGSKVTADGVSDLQKALPNCKIE